MSFVLVHGGGSTGRFWDRLVPMLDGRSLAADLPGRGGQPGELATLTVSEEAASVCAQVDAADFEDPLVLVAHSSGGLVVPQVVDALAGRVAHVVLIAALVPEEGGNGLSCMQPAHSEGLAFAVEQAAAAGTTITLPGPPEDAESFRNAYGGDPLDDEALAFMVDPRRCVPDTVHHYFQPVHWSLAADVPVTFVLTERDRPVRTPMQELMAARLPVGSAVVRVDTGHLPPVTDSVWLAELLNTIGRR